MAVRGVKEYFSEELRYFNLIEKEARQILTQMGFEEFKPPVLEEENTFVKGSGESSDIIVNKEMFYVDDYESRIVLRPEFTPKVARTYIEEGFSKKSPLWKLFYIGPCFRKERPQKGRFREFWQLGIETLGDKNIMYSFEIFLALKLILSKLGIKNYNLNISSIGCFEKCRNDYLNYLRKELEVRLDKMCPVCKTRFVRNPLRILDCKNPPCKELLKNELKNIASFLCDDCKKDKEITFELLSKNSISFKEEPFLVRGFDYYTGIVFEYTHNKLGAQDAFCGGGRYDNLLQKFGEKNAEGGVGCALGIERIILILQEEEIKLDSSEKKPKIYIAFTDDKFISKYSYLLEQLINKGFNVFSDYSKPSLKSHLKRSEGVGSDHVIIIGDIEDSKGVFSIKNLKTGKQEEVKQVELINYLTRNEKRIV